MTTVNAYATTEAHGKLEPFTYELPDIGAHQVDIKVQHCGICHSDLSMLNNDWGMTEYPFVPGHEVVGTVQAKGEHVNHLEIGQTVGLGWFSGSCMHCGSCLSGDHNLCGTAEQTVVGRHGGFADVVRCNGEWAIPLPEGLSIETVGPLFCGGATVFHPLLTFGVKPTDSVGVIGIGGLGHLALQFLNKWGCEVTAFTSSPSKAEEARELGAHHILNTRSDEDLQKAASSFDFVINTTNVTLNWDAILGTLKPKGRFHNVGAVLEPLAIPAFSLISGQKSVSGSPVGNPTTTRQMLEFCARHDIHAQTEHFPLSKVNEALEHLESGKARYRIVLDV